MRKRFRITLLFGELLLWSLTTVFVACVRSPVWGAERKEVVDRLHGFAYTPQPGWSASLVDNAILFHDTYRFILVRGVRHDGNLQKAAKSWMTERRAMDARFDPSRYAFRKVGKGIVLLGEELEYPYALLPLQRLNFLLEGATPPGNYREVTTILPGEKVAVVVSLFYPADTPKAKLDEMTAILRSLRFLPPQQMVRWRTERIMDPEVGMEAVSLHVPEGFEFRGMVVQQGGKRVPFVWIQQGDKMLRLDHINLDSTAMQAMIGGANAYSIITVNGQSVQLAQGVLPQSEDDVIQLVLALWQGETEREWTLKQKENLPTSAEQAQVEERMKQLGAQALGAMGVQSAAQGIRVRIVGESGSLRREATVQGVLSVQGRSDWVATQQRANFAVTVYLVQAPSAEFEAAVSALMGVLHSWQTSPAQAASALERWFADHRRANELLRQMTQSQREFNSKMSTAWSNLLSDQTYIRDPSTGEVSRVYKQSWETGGFWREPIFGDVLLSGVREGSKLEELLKSEGWRRMQESLEGFPQK